MYTEIQCKKQTILSRLTGTVDAQQPIQLSGQLLKHRSTKLISNLLINSTVHFYFVLISTNSTRRNSLFEFRT